MKRLAVFLMLAVLLSVPLYVLAQTDPASPLPLLPPKWQAIWALYIVPCLPVVYALALAVSHIEKLKGTGVFKFAQWLLSGPAKAWEPKADAPKPPSAPTAVFLALAIGASLLVAAPARASGPGVICLSGCDQPKFSHRLGAGQDTQLSPTVWAGPGLAIIPFVYNGATHEGRVPLQAGFSYGLWWRPPGYTATKSLAAVNLVVSGELNGAKHIDPLLMFTIADNLTIGGGIRVNLASDEQRAGVNGLFAIGWQTSLFGPP